MCRVAAFDGTVAANGLVSERTVLVVPKPQPLRWAAGAVLATMCVVSNAVRIADIVNNIPVVGLAFLPRGVVRVSAVRPHECVSVASSF